MVFSSLVFLWIFLPIVLLTYYLVDTKFKNYWLLFMSLLFYAWGEPKYIFVMILSICINYIFGILVDKSMSIKQAKILVFICVAINLLFLIYFKYTNFIIDNISRLIGSDFQFKQVALPIGISFYTFQAISYVIDVYRGKYSELEGVTVQKNFFNLALYISLFPQLIAGPIIKYKDVQSQINSRILSNQKFAYGVRRFCYGLGKKVLISNTLASTADIIFNLNANQVSASIAWLGIICYALQIYYDFSGYSDMAIGLGKMFGFDFMENFNYPYISSSIQEFWRRWHISLSTWFREYLYIPLGGNRKGKTRTYMNLLIVFLATGIWHGASWNFVVWGLIHGFFIVVERIWLGKALANNKYKFINRLYTLGVILISWVFFRAAGLGKAIEYLKNMFMITIAQEANSIMLYLDREVSLTLIVAILFCGVIQYIKPNIKNYFYDETITYRAELIILPIILLACIMYLVSGAYNPFIYFRF
ncbi:MAG: alginate O-acetyltransferase [Epulopiscium sp. Nele67-Bin004]|nr:MAG: alginate O-acetyltransferase [Epulopiscium sp. Nele67-Bin004]